MVVSPFERLMTSCPSNPYSTIKGAHRAPRLQIFHFADTQTLLTLRLVSRIFRGWIKYEEHRFFRELHLRLNLTADYHVVTPEKLAALGRLGSTVTTRMVITLLVPCRWQQKVHIKGRNAPKLPAVFTQIEGGLFKQILVSMPKLSCLCIRDRVLSTRNSSPEDEWGFTLVGQALIFLRVQIEDAHTSRIERRIKLEEDILTRETILNRPFAQIVAVPQSHLEEIMYLAQALQINELSKLIKDASRDRRSRVCRPQLERWLMSLPGFAQVLPEYQKELFALTRSTKEQLISCLEISETLLQEQIIHLTESAANMPRFTPAWQKLRDKLDNLKRRIPSSKLLERLEFFIDLAESPLKRNQILSHLDVPLPTGPLPPPVDLNELRRLSAPSPFFSFQLELSTPLALWYFRSVPRHDGTRGTWSSTITSLHISLPSPTPGTTRTERGFIKRSYNTLLSEFAPSLETLCIKFLPHAKHTRLDTRIKTPADPSFRGERVSSECPLVYFCGDLDFSSVGGEGGPPDFPRLKRLGLINTTLRWEEPGGMKEFLESRARACITLHFTDVVFGGAEATAGWVGLYKVFMLENPGWRSRFGLVLTRKFEE